jgi:hypothetical protein
LRIVSSCCAETAGTLPKGTHQNIPIATHLIVGEPGCDLAALRHLVHLFSAPWRWQDLPVREGPAPSCGRTVTAAARIDAGLSN